MRILQQHLIFPNVALRKESVDRNHSRRPSIPSACVALRKESVDRNQKKSVAHKTFDVALRKESVDRNRYDGSKADSVEMVALRKESVDRNMTVMANPLMSSCRSPQGERG